MTSEEALERFAAECQEDASMDNADAYHLLSEECGVNLLPTLLQCLQHTEVNVRAVSVSLLVHHRPHTPEIVQAIAPLVSDPEPAVRIKALVSLKEFGVMALPLTDHIYGIVQREKDAVDQVPRILAMSLLLHMDRSTWEQELTPQLVAVATAQTGGLVEFVALQCLLELQGYHLNDADLETQEE
jgi:hypothetical protein